MNCPWKPPPEKNLGRHVEDQATEFGSVFYCNGQKTYFVPQHC
jgi:hypothetical protein